MVKNRRRLIITIVVILIVFSLSLWVKSELIGWDKLTYEFSDDENGQLARRFFPDYQALPDSIKSEFEHRTTYRYYHHEKIYDDELYFLKLDFELPAEYELFLKKTENDYSDMTPEQCKASRATMDDARFEVGRYSFRAIDVSPYGAVNRDYVGLIAHCDSENTIVFLYYWDWQFSSISLEDVLDDLMPGHYSELWRADDKGQG